VVIFATALDPRLRGDDVASAGITLLAQVLRCLLGMPVLHKDAPPGLGIVALSTGCTSTGNS